jgi:hypothetical protein
LQKAEGMQKAKRSPARQLTPAEIEAERLAGEQQYLAWSRRLIDDAGWNQRCPSRRCRRNGCQNVTRCEPRLRDGLRHIFSRLLEAQLVANSQQKEIRGSREAAESAALLADARKREWLPLPERVR